MGTNSTHHPHEKNPKYKNTDLSNIANFSSTRIDFVTNSNYSTSRVTNTFISNTRKITRKNSIVNNIINENPSSPRNIAKTAIDQLTKSNKLIHPYDLIFSFHLYTPAMQYLVLKAVLERFYNPPSIAPVGALLSYEEYLEMFEPTARDVERFLEVAEALHQAKNKNKSTM